MRIIGGIHSSRKILPPEGGDVTRPITDRVKQSLFDRLTSMEALDGPALDIFAGTGSLGLEALSRGVEHCTFIERDRSARELLEQNIATLGLEEQAAVLGVNALSPAWIAALPRKPLGLIFCDPPYDMTREPKSMERVAALINDLAGVATPEAVLALRTDDRTAVPAVAAWNGPESFAYGSMVLHFYRRQAAAS